MNDRDAALPATFVYRWFAALFLAPPDATALASYRSAQGTALLARLAAEKALARPVAELRALSGEGADLNEAASRLAAAHSGAFLVGGPRSAQPYASVWLSPRGLLYQEPAREMTRLLADVGLTLPVGASEPPDHIGYQLDLLAELEDRRDATEPLPITPSAFLRDHLLIWVPAFATACAGLKNPLFYPSLSRALSEYLVANIKQNEEV